MCFQSLCFMRLLKSKSNTIRIWNAETAHWEEPGYVCWANGCYNYHLWKILTVEFQECEIRRNPYDLLRQIQVYDLKYTMKKYLALVQYFLRETWELLSYFLYTYEILFPVVCTCLLQLEENIFSNQISSTILFFTFIRWGCMTAFLPTVLLNLTKD